MVLRRLQPLQDRQTDLRRAAQHRDRPRPVRQRDHEGNLEGVAAGHGDRLCSVRSEAEAEPRPLGHHSSGSRPTAGFDFVGLQGRVPARVEQPVVH